MVPNEAESFWHAVTQELLKDCYSLNFKNFDLRYPTQSLSQRAKRAVIRLAHRYRFVRGSIFDVDALQIPELALVYGLLADEASRALFAKLVVLRILGPDRVDLPRNNDSYRQMWESTAEYVVTSNVDKKSLLGALHRYTINGLSIIASPLNILDTFLLEQYSCRRASVEVESGDVVIDGGGCLGDTALYFARCAERVFCFECVPSNVAVLSQNLGLNPVLAGKVEVIEKAISDVSGQELMFSDLGPASRPQAGGAVPVITESIDDFVARKDLERIDFIKMDIEGAEPAALRGAEATIRRFKPRLAICIYHDIRHFSEIPLWIQCLNLGYRLYIDHFSLNENETVLFATTRADS